MSIFIRFAGLPEAAQTVLAVLPALEKRTIELMSQVAYDKAFEGALGHNKGGALLQSLFNRPTDAGREVGHDPRRAPHAIFVQFGTRPHEIRPKPERRTTNSRRKTALRWPTTGGKFAFARVVHHPGYVGDPYLIRAADTAVREFARIVDQAMKEQR